MTDPIEALADALDTLPLAVRQGLVGVVQTFGEQLLDYNRQYLQKGQKPDGTPVDSGGYSPPYAAYRAKYGKQTAVKDLNFTGAYYDSFLLPYVGGLQFEVENSDSKAKQLLTSYGELYGIREADIEDFITTYLLPEVAQLIRTHMQLAL